MKYKIGKKLMLLIASMALMLSIPAGAFAASWGGKIDGHDFSFNNSYTSTGAFASTAFSLSGVPKSVSLSYTYRNLGTLTDHTLTNSNSNISNTATTTVTVPSGISHMSIGGSSSHIISYTTTLSHTLSL